MAAYLGGTCYVGRYSVTSVMYEYLYVVCYKACKLRMEGKCVIHVYSETTKNVIFKFTLRMCGPGSSGGIVTELRAGRSGIESRWGRDFPPVQTSSGAHPASYKMGTGSFPGVDAAGAWG